MKKLFLSLFSFCSIWLSSFSQNETNPSLVKGIIVELDSSSSPFIFSPYSDAWSSMGFLMGNDDYNLNFKNRYENLWTIIHPNIMNGSVNLYYTYNPMSWSQFDNGELKYPILHETGKSFFNDSVYAENLKGELGYTFIDPNMSPLVTQEGEDSVVIGADGSYYTVYPAPEYYWFVDSDVVKYKLRVDVEYNKKGKEIRRTIVSIAPVVKFYENNDRFGVEYTFRDLCWIKYDELKVILKDIYFFNANGKPELFLEYIDNRIK